MITRRLFTFGLLAAPAIIRTPGLLMPIRDPLRVRKTEFVVIDSLTQMAEFLPPGEYTANMLSVDYADVERRVMTMLFETNTGKLVGGKVYL